MDEILINSNGAYYNVEKVPYTYIRKRNLSLPDETVELIKSLNRQEFISYCRALKAEGWTLQSIADAKGITRERIRQLVVGYPEVSASIDHLSVPKLPVIEAVKVVKKVREVPDGVAMLLKNLHSKAYWVRGKSSLNRKEAEQLGELISDLIYNQFYSINQVAKAIGVSHLAIRARLVRYGYAKSDGKTRIFRQLTHRAKVGD